MNNKGYTIVEILIATSVGLIVMGAIYAGMNMGQRSSVAVERKVLAQQDARAALEIMALEIRMASYNPTYATGMWCDGPSGNCGNLSANQTYKGIQEATANSITVEMDIRGNTAGSYSDGAMDDPNEIIRYNYDTANERITRETSCGGGGQAFLGPTLAHLDQRDVQVANNTAGAGGTSIPLFRYYDGRGTELVPGTDLPADIPNIRRIEITLVVDTEAEDPNLGKRRRTIYSTSVIPRNHAIN